MPVDVCLIKGNRKYQAKLGDGYQSLEKYLDP